MSDTNGDLEQISALLRRSFPLRGKDLVIELASASPRVEGNTIWVPLRFVYADRTIDKSVFLIKSSQRADPRRDAFVQGWIEALAIVLRDAVERISPASVDVRFPIDAASGATPASFRDDLLKRQWLGRHLARERQTPSAAYEKAPAAVALPGGQLDLNALLLWIERQVTISWEDGRRDQATLAAVPEPVRVAWLLFGFEGNFYNGGIGGVLQQSEWIVDRCRDALRAVGAKTLLGVLDAGEGDDAQGELLERELRPRLAAYCAANRDELIR